MIDYVKCHWSLIGVGDKYKVQIKHIFPLFSYTFIKINISHIALSMIDSMSMFIDAFLKATMVPTITT